MSPRGEFAAVDVVADRLDALGLGDAFGFHPQLLSYDGGAAGGAAGEAAGGGGSSYTSSRSSSGSYSGSYGLHTDCSNSSARGFDRAATALVYLEVRDTSVAALTARAFLLLG